MAGRDAVTASPATVSPGGMITVVVANGPGNAKDWVALAATGTPATSSVRWKYVGGGTSATLQFVAPSTPGTYEARFLANDEFIRLATSSPITVQAPPTLTINSVSLPEGNSGTTMATFTATLSPTSSNIVTVNYATANGTATAGSDYVAASGMLTFAPGVATQTIAVAVTGDTTWEPNETFAVALSSPTNAVLGGGAGTGTIVNDDAAPIPTVTASPTTVSSGGMITVVVANGPGNSNDWVALAPTGAPDTSAAVWKYIGGGTSATLQLAARVTPGTYEVRLLANDEFIRLATSGPITVQAPPSPTLTVSPTTVNPGDMITVSVANGPGNPKDWVALASTSAPETSSVAWKYLGGGTSGTLQFVAPSTPGTYEARFLTNDEFTRLATSGAITVQAPPGSTPTITVSPTTVNPGGMITVVVTNGPGNPKDWVALAATGAPATSSVKWKYIGGGTSATLQFVAPSTPGTYEARFLADDGFTRLATSDPFTVGP